MGDADSRETCGRCSMTAVVDAVEEDADERYDPFGDAYIEVDRRELRIASVPAVYAGRVKRWLDEKAHRAVHGR